MDLNGRLILGRLPHEAQIGAQRYTNKYQKIHFLPQNQVAFCAAHQYAKVDKDTNRIWFLHAFDNEHGLIIFPFSGCGKSSQFIENGGHNRCWRMIAHCIYKF